MADDCDYAKEVEEASLARNLAQVLRHSEIKPGCEGECERCGEESKRLINQTCAPCRDRYKLP